MSKYAGMRAIVGARVSRVDGDGKTSHLTQHAASRGWVERHYATVVGSFQDMNVSADIHPMQRPELGPWLNEKFHEWDIIVWAVVDRAFRSVGHLVDLQRWGKANNKILVFADDNIVADQDMDENTFLLLAMKAVLAQNEHSIIKRRNKKARQQQDREPRFPGGTVPYGFRCAKRDGQPGFTLVVDEETAEIIQGMARMFLAGQSTQQIADFLTDQGVPTPRQRMYDNAVGTALKGTRPTSGKWNKSSITDMLKSQTMLGYKCLGRPKSADRRIARDDNDEPIRFCDEGPLSEELFEAVQEEMARRGWKRERRKDSAPLLGIVYCLTCGHRLYRAGNNDKGGRRYMYYRCPTLTGKKACPKHGWREEMVEEVVSHVVANHLADVEVTEPKYYPAEDYSKELADVTRQVDRYLELITAADFNPVAMGTIAAKLKEATDRQEQLKLLPNRKARIVQEGTGVMYAEAWNTMGETERKDLMTNRGIRICLGKDEAGVDRIVVQVPTKAPEPELERV